MKKALFLLLIFFISSEHSTIFAQIEPEMVYVKGGKFLMGSNNGSDDEKPVHSVTVSNFYIGKYEITVAQYQEFCAATSKSMPPMPDEEWYEEHYNATKWAWKDRNPIVNVNWNDANAYCKWLSEKTGKTYRLPTEAEWEFAARGGTQSKGYKYSGNNNVNRIAWYDETTYERGPRPVGTLPPNEIGVYDMSGNAWEWCYDRYGTYSGSAQTNPQGAARGPFRVIRGGGWYYTEEMCKITTRDGPYPHYTNFNYGFRVVREP